MIELKTFTIPFIGIKVGEHTFKFKIDNTFFEHFEYEEFNNSAIDLEVLLTKKTTLLEFLLKFEGEVNVNCDITNEPFDQPVEGEFHFVVKFGEAYSDDNEELIILPHGAHEINIQQPIYESIVLAVPQKRVHPGIADGTLQSEILEKLEELSPKMDKEASQEDTDPRWDTLKKLLTDK